MTRMIETLNQRAQPFANMAQPVIVAIGTAGLTGGTMAAIGLIADRALRRHRAS
ncbi:hypothetical protein EDF56_10928 [Novosphingobium sp. PhB165]|uniref:hypothetical protein n=1 Tax=Novosphingobium sp. PhB165 TaxID=2485105 RepID=UPI0010EE472F|nr:hypothetical protein [Novosphingobium sp. PhB165]TCM15699.1 hypothetical protein EDF56_10928 [Novosphingobium sp. PhB165]